MEEEEKTRLAAGRGVDNGNPSTAGEVEERRVFVMCQESDRIRRDVRGSRVLASSVAVGQSQPEQAAGGGSMGRK